MNKEYQTKINYQIKVPFVRLIIDEKDLGIVSTENARHKAQQMELDLVEVAPNQKPPVCRIMDYAKFKYDQKKKQKKSKPVIWKDIYISPVIEQHDVDVKINQMQRFLEKNIRVRIILEYSKRQTGFLEHGKGILEQMVKKAQDLNSTGDKVTTQIRIKN